VCLDLDRVHVSGYTSVDSGYRDLIYYHDARQTERLLDYAIRVPLPWSAVDG
jgi:hypothetical protein